MLEILLQIGVFAAGYILGAVSAYFIMKTESQFKFEPKQIERIFILATVTGIWGVSNGYDIFNTGYESPAALHALFGAVVGFYFDIAIFDKLGLLKKK